MAVATATVAVATYPNGVDNTQRHEVLFGTIAVQASPATYATGGLAVSFQGSFLHSNSATPLWCDVQSTTGSGYVYQYLPATGKVKILVQGSAEAAPMEELAAAAVPAGVSGDTIKFRAEFNRSI